MTKIEELEQKLREASSGFEFVINEIRKELVCYKTQKELKESKKEGKWKPKVGEKYWLINTHGLSVDAIWTDSSFDNWRYNNIPIFPTKESCERYWHFMDTVKEKSYSFSEEEWFGYGIRKYFIYYDYRVEQVRVGNEFATKDFNKPYFKTEEDAQYIIDNFKDELMKFFI